MIIINQVSAFSSAITSVTTAYKERLSETRTESPEFAVLKREIV